MIRFLTTLILLKSVFAFACDMDRATSETQFVIDPSLKLMKIESKKDLSVFEVSKCSLDEKFILINFNTIYYQDDTSRRESISGQLLTQTSNCSIKTEQPIQKIENGFLDQLVKEKYNFIKQCSRLVITDLRGQKITTSPNSNCQLKPLDASGSSVETDGSNCFIAMTPNTRLEVKTKLNPECLDTNFLKVHQIEAQDFETVIRLWPIQADQGQMKVQSPFGARYLRYTVLPEAQFMPRAVLDEQSQFSFVSVLTTNIHPGQIAISQMGKSMINIQPNFIVENFSKKYCKEQNCARPAGFMMPISGLLKLTQINLPNSKKQQQVGEWTYSMKVPANWAGVAEMRPENNLTGISMGGLTTNFSLKPNSEFILEANFYEPRSMMDELSYTQSFFDLNNILDPEVAGDNALPTLPKIGQLGRLDKMPQLPTISLGKAGILEFSDRMNMAKSWTHHYDRVCNSENLKCARLSGIDKAIIKIKMYFKIGAQKEVIAQRVVKESEVFDSYDINVSSFAKKVCE